MATKKAKIIQIKTPPSIQKSIDQKIADVKARINLLTLRLNVLEAKRLLLLNRPLQRPRKILSKGVGTVPVMKRKPSKKRKQSW